MDEKGLDKTEDLAAKVSIQEHIITAQKDTISGLKHLVQKQTEFIDQLLEESGQQRDAIEGLKLVIASMIGADTTDEAEEIK